MRERNDLDSLFTQESKNPHTRGKSTNSHYEKGHNISNPSFRKRMSQKKVLLVNRTLLLGSTFLNPKALPGLSPISHHMLVKPLYHLTADLLQMSCPSFWNWVHSLSKIPFLAPDDANSFLSTLIFKHLERCGDSD